MKAEEMKVFDRLLWVHSSVGFSGEINPPVCFL